MANHSAAETRSVSPSSVCLGVSTVTGHSANLFHFQALLNIFLLVFSKVAMYVYYENVHILSGEHQTTASFKSPWTTCLI